MGKQSLWKIFEKNFSDNEKIRFSSLLSFNHGNIRHDEWIILDANNVSFQISFVHGGHEALGESYSREFFLALYLSGYNIQIVYDGKADNLRSVEKLKRMFNDLRTGLMESNTHSAGDSNLLIPESTFAHTSSLCRTMQSNALDWLKAYSCMVPDFPEFIKSGSREADDVIKEMCIDIHKRGGKAIILSADSTLGLGVPPDVRIANPRLLLYRGEFYQRTTHKILLLYGPVIPISAFLRAVQYVGIAHMRTTKASFSLKNTISGPMLALMSTFEGGEYSMRDSTNATSPYQILKFINLVYSVKEGEERNPPGWLNHASMIVVLAWFVSRESSILHKETVTMHDIRTVILDIVQQVQCAARAIVAGNKDFKLFESVMTCGSGYFAAKAVCELDIAGTVHVLLSRYSVATGLPLDIPPPPRTSRNLITAPPPSVLEPIGASYHCYWGRWSSLIEPADVDTEGELTPLLYLAKDWDDIRDHFKDESEGSESCILKAHMKNKSTTVTVAYNQLMESGAHDQYCAWRSRLFEEVGESQDELEVWEVAVESLIAALPTALRINATAPVVPNRPQATTSHTSDLSWKTVKTHRRREGDGYRVYTEQTLYSYALTHQCLPAKGMLVADAADDHGLLWRVFSGLNEPAWYSADGGNDGDIVDIDYRSHVRVVSDLMSVEVGYGAGMFPDVSHVASRTCLRLLVVAAYASGSSLEALYALTQEVGVLWRSFREGVLSKGLQLYGRLCGVRAIHPPLLDFEVTLCATMMVSSVCALVSKFRNKGLTDTLVADLMAGCLLSPLFAMKAIAYTDLTGISIVEIEARVKLFHDNLDSFLARTSGSVSTKKLGTRNHVRAVDLLVIVIKEVLLEFICDDVSPYVRWFSGSGILFPLRYSSVEDLPPYDLRVCGKLLELQFTQEQHSMNRATMITFLDFFHI